MITRMEITYRSKEPYSKKPETFTTGGYEITKDGTAIHFDFEEMEAGSHIKNGHIYIECLQKNVDDSLIKDINPDMFDRIIQSAKKEDFTEIFYECYSDAGEQHFIELVPISIVFYDFSQTGDGQPIEVGGKAFSNLIT